MIPKSPRYGAHIIDRGVNFSIFSSSARQVKVLLYDDMSSANPSSSHDLQRTGDIWHGVVGEAKEGQFYLYEIRPEGIGGHLPDRIRALDPCSIAVCSPRAWGERRGLKKGSTHIAPSVFPKGLILRDNFDWEDDAPPRHPLRDLVIYELHVRGFTRHQSSGVADSGTYRGMIDKIPYLQELGINAVELLPIHEFNEMELFMHGGPRAELVNFWGYSTLAYFAPNARYAADTVPGAQIREFKEMIKAFHSAGIEVILDVVFNHTAEGDEEGPIYHFKALGDNVFYMKNRKGKYLDFTGCGNSVNANHPVVQDMIIDSLRYWVNEMHVDGFRFDLASVLCRDRVGKVLKHPPIIERITHDPELRGVKLIAEAWDAHGLYQVADFPGAEWCVWNGKYRDEVRAYWRGEPGSMGPFATRISGSQDFYGNYEIGPLKSVNMITCHDGFTLRDLVSYEEKHNEVNGENNQDGENHNLSMNFGVEGETDDPNVLNARLQQQKNLIATLLLSQGIPMLTAGDEFGRTQNGNNNGYNQDNETSWLDWDLLESYGELHDFVRELLSFRKAHNVLRRDAFLEGISDESDNRDVQWLGPDGPHVDWHGGQVFGRWLHHHPEYGGESEDILTLFNASADDVQFKLPGRSDIVWQHGPSSVTLPDVKWHGEDVIELPARSLITLCLRCSSE